MALFIYPAVSIDTSGLATEAKQDVIITELMDVNTELDAQTVILTSLDGKDYATETTLATKASEATLATRASETTVAAINSDTTTIAGDTTSIDAKIPAQGAAATSDSLPVNIASDQTVPVSAVSLPLPTGAATEATLSSVDTKLDSQATAANQTTANASLSNIETDLDELNARLAGNLVPETFDYIAMTYVAAGNGTGEIETVTYRTGGAAGSIVATLTLAYDGTDRLSNVTRS